MGTNTSSLAPGAGNKQHRVAGMALVRQSDTLLLSVPSHVVGLASALAVHSRKP